MFSNAMVALIFALGFSGWVYTKVNRSTGGNTQSSLIVTGIAAVFSFVILLMLLNMIPN